MHDTNQPLNFRAKTKGEDQSVDCKGCLEHTYSAWDACKFLSHYNVMSLGPWKHPIREEKAKEMHKEGPRTRVELALGVAFGPAKVSLGCLRHQFMVLPLFLGGLRGPCVEEGQALILACLMQRTFKNTKCPRKVEESFHAQKQNMQTFRNRYLIFLPLS